MRERDAQMHGSQVSVGIKRQLQSSSVQMEPGAPEGKMPLG